MRIACLLIFAVLSLWNSAYAAETPTDLERAWQIYFDTNSHLDPAYTFPHNRCFDRAAAAHGLPKTLLLAVARGESDFEPAARSRANAHGVMQILWPVTARHLGIHRLSELYDPCTNIEAGTRYLKELLKRYDDNLHLALAAYNYGPNRIPPRATEIPSGARWYSGYIYRHLNYVLGDGKARGMKSQVGEHLYSALGQSTLVTFGEPYRAAAFIDRLEASAPDLNLDWFRRDTGKFEVVMSYEGREDFDRHAALLAQAGFRLD
ncbi:MAG: transglycosylase SLT domain-containing protein [Woeseiaceae bacterium]|nr:transglycosylase SLT domain-containing protein [Woeseiaceae bacterium]